MLDRWDAALRDVCRELDCEEVDKRGRRERTYLRDGDSVKLAAAEHALDHEAFYDAAGDKLSNHVPQWARILWTLVE